ncbi:MAG TPA: hypothetical protein GXZ32_05095, partial [Clostridiales bacterium]|nr:hypothetical protein [Clostridiales bacterium]
GAGGGAAGVAGSVVVKVIGTTTQAYIGANARINQDVGFGSSGQSVVIRAQDRVISVGAAGAGAGGGAAGVGASADVTIVRNLTSAYIGDGAYVNARKNIDIIAISDKYVNSIVIAGSGGGAAGVAGAVSVIVVGSVFDSHAKGGLSNCEGEGNTQDAVDSQIGTNLAKGLLGNSDEAEEVESILDSHISQIGIGKYFNESSQVALNNTQAFIGFNARVNAGENLTIKADDKTVAIAGDIAGSGGGAAGVAGAMSIIIIHDSVQAFIAAGARTNAGKNTTIQANTSDNVYTAGVTGSGAGAAAVNGVAKVTVIRTQTKAYIANDARVNEDSGYATPLQSVLVIANGHTYIVTVGASGGGAGAAAVGGVANIGVLTKDTQAFIGQNARVYAQKDIVISAESTQLLVAVTASIFGAGAAAVSGDVGTFTFSNTTLAYVDKGALVDSEGNVKISATDDSLLISVVGVGNGAGAAAVGGALSVNVITSVTKAYIDDGATVNARGNAEGIDVYTGELGDPSALPRGPWDDEMWIDTDGDGEVDTKLEVNKNIDADGDGTPDGSVDDGINLNLKSKNSSGGSDAGKSINISGEGLGIKKTHKVKGLSVVALSNQKMITTTIAIAGAGAAGVTGANTTNVLDGVTEAYIGNGAKINQNIDNASDEQLVIVKAGSITLLVMTEGSIGGAAVAGVSGSANEAIISNKTVAHAGGTIKAKRDIMVIARSEEDVHVVTANVSGAGIAGVGGAAGVAVIEGETLAYIHAGADLWAGRDIIVLAYNDGTINIDTLGGSGGEVAGVGGAVSVGVITHTTKAYVENAANLANGAILYAARTIDIKAESKEKIIGIAVCGAGGGAAGVAGAVVVKVVNTTTQAYIGNYAQVNQVNYSGINENQTVKVTAIDTVDVTGSGGSGTVSGVAGVGASVDVTVIRNTVTAYIGDYAKVRAYRYNSDAQPAGNIIVEARSNKIVESYVIGASGGGSVGISASVSVVSIGAKLNNDSKESLSNNGSFVDGEISKDFVTGNLGNSEHTQGIESMVAGKLTGLNISSYLNETSADSLNKTRAYIGTGAEVTADNDITISARDNTKVSILAGGASAGTVGVGGGVGIATVNTTTEAFAGNNSKLWAGRNITIEAVNQADGGTQYSVIAFGGGAGLVGGIGASVAYLDVNNTVRSYIGTGAQVSKANELKVNSTVNNTLKAEAVGASGGVNGAVGASLARANLTGRAESYLGNSVSVQQTVSINVRSQWISDINATSWAGAFGIGASGNGAVALASADPIVSAYFGNNVNINTSGSINILSQSEINVYSKTFGVSVGAVNVGASVSEARIAPVVSAYIGSGNVKAGGGIRLESLHNSQSNGATVDKGATAEAEASGGSLVGGTGAHAKAISSADVYTYTGSGSVLEAGQSIAIRGISYNKAVSKAYGITGGLVAAVGAALADATTDGITRAYMNGRVNNGSAFQVVVQGFDTASAESWAAAGGIAAGSGNHAKATVSPIVESYLGNGAVVVVSGNVEVIAHGIANAYARTWGVSAGAATVGVSLAHAVISSEVSAYFGNNVSVNAGGDIIIKALHNYNFDGAKRGEKAQAVANASGGGALVGATGAEAKVSHTAQVNAYVGTGANVSAGRDVIIQALGNINGLASGDGNSGGVVGIGGVVVEVSNNGVIKAYIDSTTQNPSNVVAGRHLTVSVLGSSTPTATSEQAAGGIVSGGGSSANAVSQLQVNAYLGTSGGTFSSNTGNITVKARGDGSINAEAKGINVGGISVGASTASANWVATIGTSVGKGTALTAGNNIDIIAEHVNDWTRSYATTSTGNLVGGVGSNADVTAVSTVECSFGQNSSLQAGNNINIRSESWSVTEAEASGSAYGVAAAGITKATNILVDTTGVKTENGVSMEAGNDLNISALSTTKARKCHATGGAGGVAAGASTSADTDLNVLTTVILGAGSRLTADNINEILAQSSMDADGWAKIDTGGAVTFNRTQSNVDVYAVTQVEIANGCTVEGRDTYILAKVIRLYANSFAYSKTYAVHSKSEGISRLNVTSITNVVVRGATLRGGNTLEIRSRQDGIDTDSHSHGEIGAGATGSIITEGSNNLSIDSFVDVKSGSKLYSDDILVEAESPRDTAIYGKDAAAVAHTAVEYVTEFIEKVTTVVEKVVEKIVKWAPWPFNLIISWITKTVTRVIRETVKVVKEVILDSEVSSSTPGSFTSDNRINLEGDIYLGNAAGVSVIIDPDGTIHTSGTITAYRSGNEIIINPFTNQQMGVLKINSPRGAVTGNAVVHQNSIVSLLEIINNSNYHLRINGINLISDDLSKPSEYIYAEDGRDTINITYTTDITSMPIINIICTKAANIIIAGIIENMTGTVNINTAGGSVYFAPGGAIEAYILNMSAPLGNIGESPSKRAILRLYKKDSYNPTVNIEAGGNGYLDIQLREIRLTPSGDPIDNIKLGNIDVGGLLDILASQAHCWSINPEDGVVIVDAKGVYIVQTITSGNGLIIRLVSGDLHINGSIQTQDDGEIAVSGSIQRGQGSGPEIVAGNLVLTAGGDIGQSFGLVRIRLKSLAVINVIAGGNTYLHEVAGNINLGIVQSGGNVHLKAQGSILDNDNTGNAVVSGNDVTMEALSGTIGTKDGFVDILACGLLNATAKDGIYINQVDGLLNLGSINATHGNIWLKALKSILDNDNTDAVNIKGTDITLQSITGSIGTADNFLDIIAAGVLNAAAKDGIYIYEVEGTMDVDTVTSAEGDVYLKTAGSILDSNANDEANVIGKNITLVAITGGIGAIDNFLDIIAAGVLNATAKDGIYIYEVEGTMDVDTVTSAEGDIYLKAADSILDSNDNDDANVIGKNITLVAITGGIGDIDNFLDIVAAGVLNATAKDSIYIYEVFGTMDIGVVTSVEGDVYLKAKASILDSNDNDDVNVTGKNITLVSIIGSIGTLDNFLDIDSGISAAGKVDATALRSIYLYEEKGDLNVGLISSITGDIYLKAQGNITDHYNTDLVNVIGNNITLVAITGGIGTIDNFLDIIAKGVLNAAAVRDIFIYEIIGAMDVGVVTSTTGDVYLKAAGSVLDSMNTDTANVIGKNITLVSILGSIGKETNFLDVVATGVVNAAALGDIFIYEIIGNMDVGVVTSAVGDIYLRAEGSIMDGNDNDDANVMGKNITLEAINGGIGAIDNFLDIIAAGVLNATAKGGIYIYEVEGTMDVDVVTSEEGNVYLKAEGSILDSNDNDDANVIGRNITLVAITGSIGTLDNFLDVAAKGVLNATAKGGIYIFQVEGSLNLDVIESGTSDIYLKAKESILDANNNDEANIIGRNVTLEAINGGIGTLDNFLDVAAKGVLNAMTKGDIYIYEIAGTMNLGIVRSLSGDVHLMALEPIMDSNNNDNANIIGGNITLLAIKGGVGTLNNFLDIMSKGLVDVLATKSIYIYEVDSTMDLGLVISIDGDVYLKGLESILDGENKDNVNVIGNHITLVSLKGGIGTKDNFVNIVALGILNAKTVKSIYIYQMVGDMNLDVVTSTGGDVHLIAAENIVDANNNNSNNVIGRHITLVSETGGIGSSDNFLDIDSTDGKVDAQAVKDIFLVDTAGNLNVGVIKSTTGDIYLKANGYILDYHNNGKANIIGNNITLESIKGGVGNIDNLLDLDSAVGTKGEVNIKAAGGIYVQEVAGNLSIGQITSKTGDVYVKAAGHILDHDNTDGANIIGRSITLVSVTGGIGSIDNFLDIDSAANRGGKVDANAATHVYLHEIAGDMSLGNVNATTGDVYLKAQGSILDHDNNTKANAKGRNITLEAIKGGIGKLNNYMDVSATGKLTARATGSIYIYEVAGNMNLVLAVSNTGDVYLKAKGSILDSNGTNEADVIGNNIILESTQGGIGTSNNFLDINSAQSKSGRVDAAATGSIYLYETAGNLSIGLISSMAGDVYLSARGSIVDNNNNDMPNVVGRNLNLEAMGGIGTLGNFLDIRSAVSGAGKVDASAPSGIYLYQMAGNLAAGVIISSSGDVHLKARQSILDYNRTDAANVIGNNITFEAMDGGIGEVDNYLDISARAVLKATARGSIHIYEVAGVMNLDVVVSATGDVYFRAAGSILDYGNTQSANVIGNNITLVAIRGGIGSSNNYLDIDSSFSAGGRVDVQSSMGVYLREVSGDMAIGLIQSPRDVHLMGVGGIRSAQGQNNIRASMLWFDIPSGFGTAQRPIMTNVGQLEGRSRNGSIWLINTGDLTLGLVEAGGEIDLTVMGRLVNGSGSGLNVRAATFRFRATSGVGSAQRPINTMVSNLEGRVTNGDIWIFNNGTVTLGTMENSGDVNLRVSGSVLAQSGAGVNIRANRLWIYTTSGIGTSQAPLRTAVSYLEGSGGTASIWITNTGDLTVGFVDANKDIYLTTTGRLLGGSGNAVNISANRFWFNADSGVGTQQSPLRTMVNYLAGTGRRGVINIINSGRLIIGGIGNGTGLQAGSGINVTAESPLMVMDNLRSTGDIVLTAQDSSGLGDDITVRSGVSITSSSGAVTLRAGDDIVIHPGSTIRAAGRVILFADYGNADAGMGSTVYIRGSITAQRLQIEGNNDNDVFYIATGSITCPVYVYGMGGSNLFVVKAQDFSSPMYMYGGNGDDRFDINGSGLKNKLVLDGRSGADAYNIRISGAGRYTIDVTDTGNDGSTDKLTIRGSSSSNTFLLRRGFVAVGSGSNLTERINYNGNIELLEIYGGGSNNRFYLDDNSTHTKIYGGSGNNFFQIGQMYGFDRNGLGARASSYRDDVSTIQTTRGYLSNGISYETYIFGGSGNDTFSVYSNKAPLWLYGMGGRNTFIIRAFALAQRAEDGSVMYNMNAPLYIEGGKDDNIIIVGTEFGRDFDLSQGGVSGMGLNLTMKGVENVEVVRDLPLEPGLGLDGESLGTLPETPFMYRDVVTYTVIAVAAALAVLYFILRRKRRLASKEV